MTRLGSFVGLDLVTVQKFIASFEDLHIAAAQLVDAPVHEYNAGGSLQDECWTAAFLHAQCH